MRLQWLGIVFLVTACGDYRAASLKWPAQIASLEGIEGSAHEKVTSDIEELNGRLAQPILQVGTGAGSPIFIKKVSSFTSSDAPSLISDSDEFATVGLPFGFRGNMGTRIAGRATLDYKQCLIELGDFLFEEKSANLLQAVLWHEIGHCAGLLHVEESGRVMSKITLPINKYSEEVLELFFSSLQSSIGNQPN